MGISSSKLEKALSSFPETERFFGLENFGNTCYCNSVLQALYFCEPFRTKVIEHHKQTAKSRPADGGQHKTSLLDELGELYVQIRSQKKRCGSLGPRKFVTRLKEVVEQFAGPQHQDAHEMLNALVNSVQDSLLSMSMNRGVTKKTWLQDLMEGTLTTETRCLTCECTTSREECYLDLSLEVEQCSSLTACINNFCRSETMAGDDKFYCERCCALQEAQKRMKLQRLPRVLALHLKRFKYVEALQRHKKLAYRVPFPQSLTVGEGEHEARYELSSVVIHIGSGPSHGHYMTLAKSNTISGAARWLLFDDEAVDLMEDEDLEKVYGLTQDTMGTTDTGYILFYCKSSAASSTSTSFQQVS